jgi:predicted transcriptional regulator
MIYIKLVENSSRGVDMRRSKLEMYIDILKVLAQRGPLKLTHIMYKANVNCSVLKEYLDFLIRELKVMLPVIDDGQARLPASLY